MVSFNLLLTNHYLCAWVFTNEAIKLSRLQEHLFKMHVDKKDKDLSYFQILKEKYFKQPTVSNLFESTTKQDDDSLRVSYNISL